MSYCEKCGAQIANDAKFCYKCGTPLTTTTVNMLYCRKCGIQIANDAKFCYKCGTPTTGPIPMHPQTPAPIPPSPPTPLTIQPQNTYEHTFNKTVNKENLLIITISLLVITVVALVIAIVAFSPLTNIFNTHPFGQPGINTVKIPMHLLRLMI